MDNLIKRIEEKASNSPYRNIFDKAFETLNCSEQKRLYDLSNNWYKGNTKKVKIELLAENIQYMFLIKKPIYEKTDNLLDVNIMGYDDTTLINLDDRKRIKLSKSEIKYFKAIREEMKSEIYYNK